MLYLLAVIAVFAWVFGFHGLAAIALWVTCVLLVTSLTFPVIAGPFAITLTEMQRKAPRAAITREPWWA